MRNSANNTVQAAKPAGKPSTKRNASGHTTAESPPRCRDWQSSSWPFRTMDTSPLAWWRTMPADLLGDAEQLLLRDTIGKVGVLKGREWVSAMRGDAPASIAIALEALPISTVTLEVDLAMTLLMSSALGGSAAAALVLSQVLQRCALEHPFGKELSVSWLVFNLRRAMAGKAQVKALARSRNPADLDAGASA
jgi:hypothetical protein